MSDISAEATAALEHDVTCQLSRSAHEDRDLVAGALYDPPRRAVVVHVAVREHDALDVLELPRPASERIGQGRLRRRGATTASKSRSPRSISTR